MILWRNIHSVKVWYGVLHYARLHLRVIES